MARLAVGYHHFLRVPLMDKILYKNYYKYVWSLSISEIYLDIGVEMVGIFP
jgi:hypothetical protein